MILEIMCFICNIRFFHLVSGLFTTMEIAQTPTQILVHCQEYHFIALQKMQFLLKKLLEWSSW